MQALNTSLSTTLTAWHSFLVNCHLRPGVLLPCFDNFLRKYIFLRFAKETIQCLVGN